MRIAVSARGSDLTSDVDPRFGRAAYFIIFDTEEESFSVISNGDNADATQGAGVQAAQQVARQAVDIVVSGNMGPKAFETLHAAGVKMVAWSDGTVADAIEMVRSGEYHTLDSANTRGHWQ